ncbi:MAG TPA: hypothetical protein VMP08_20780 [Anaerolineae bacterium]|nr:hypothetical protein [Anaerolineae bacterium]
MTNQSEKTPSHDRVLIVTRILAAIIVPILVAAFVMLFLFPDDTGRLFAWPIKPPMSAMMLGATYLGGAYFFARVVFARQWHTVKLGFLPVTAFAAVLGISTVLHWDRFTPGHISFILWAFLYFTLPLVIPIVWYLNRRVNRADPASSEPRLSLPVSLAIGALGAVLAVVSVVLLVLPAVMIPTWPWTLSPLTARVMAAMFALSGLVGLGIAVDRRWSSARIIFQAQAISIVLILVSIVRASDEITWTQWESWLFIVGQLLVLALIGWAGLQSRKSRTAAQSITTAQ